MIQIVTPEQVHCGASARALGFGHEQPNADERLGSGVSGRADGDRHAYALRRHVLADAGGGSYPLSWVPKVRYLSCHELDRYPCFDHYAYCGHSRVRRHFPHRRRQA